MELRPEEISALIKEKIKHYSQKIEEKDVGVVIKVGDGIALVNGLSNAMAGELLDFGHDVFGMVLNLEEDHVGCVLLGEDVLVKESDVVTRTGKIVEVPVGDGLLGRVVNALGKAIDGGPEIKFTKTRPIERVAPGVMTREYVHDAVQTGIKMIDSIIPIGRGQRELIIGDRQTGKTAIAIDTIINQKDQNMICIYVAIGQKSSTVAQIVEKLRQHQAMDNTVVVSATASELASLQFIAPYAGCAMGEEWLQQGKDVLIVYDDLSKHAVAYRAMSLLLRRPPGREAYPGDVFYLHSRLLERACKLNSENGGGSITALPIIETQAGDISAYIPTNVISITDGQLFLQTELFNSGSRPAVDSGLSVSRVGSTAQTQAMKQVASSIKLELAQYRELLSFAQFGSDLDSNTKSIIEHGARLSELLKQAQYSPLSLSHEVITLFSAKHKFIKDIPIKQIKAYQEFILSEFDHRYPELVKEIEHEKAISDDLENKLKTAMESITKQFIKVNVK
ncbi:MAG: F0F1 ATP synthase subunit alpha [Erysipelotrichaceae bacterium]